MYATIKVDSLDELTELLERADRQACELQETIERISALKVAVHASFKPYEDKRAMEAG